MTNGVKMLLGAAGGSANLAFEFTVETTGAAETFTLPCADTGTYDAVIDWGDGGPTSTITTYNDADLAHVYASANTYAVSITGTLPWVYFNNSGDKLKIKEITNWGDVGFANLTNAFYGCSNLTCTATDNPGFDLVTSAVNAFRSCINFNGQFGTAPVFGNVTNISFMFTGCAAFNQSISNFDTSSVTNMSGMFNGCVNFNQSVSAFDTSSVTTMASLFKDCANFNQSVSNFDTTLVTSMASMFNDCANFNQSISVLDTSNITDASYMFYRCTDFNQSFAGLDFTSVTNMLGMFTGVTSLDQTNIDTFLLQLYTDRASFTWATPTVDISAAATPSGTYQDGDPPTTGLEYVYELELDPEIEGFNTWTITYT